MGSFFNPIVVFYNYRIKKYKYQSILKKGGTENEKLTSQ